MLSSLTVANGQALSPVAACKQCTQSHVYVRYNGPTQPPLINSAPYHVGIWTPSNTWFLGSTGVSPPNSISIGSAVSTQLTHVPNTQTTLRATSVAIVHICAMHACEAA